MMAMSGAVRAAPVGHELSFGIPGNMPLAALQDGRVVGVIAETAVMALESMGWRAQPRLLPFKRMYLWVHTDRLDVAVSVLRTSERAELAHYSDPIVVEYNVVMTPKGREFSLQKIADLQGKRLGGQLGFRYPQLDGAGVKLILEKDYATNIRKIADEKLDGALIGSITGPFLVRHLGLSDRVAFLPVAIGAVPLGVAFSKSALTADDLHAFNAEIKRLQSDTAWRKVLSDHGVEPWMKAWPLVSH